ncbi:MAG: rhodanese-like domain-containing protein [Acidobacteria bacterium]|nr:rhodanese-like domain-containing protein [Acidobacteriota bacterium]
MKHVMAGLMLFICGPVLFGSPQQHPSVAPGASETAAKHLHSLLSKNAKILVIDVRTPEEYSNGRIPDAINIPIDDLPKTIQQLHIPKDTTIITVCDQGGRSSRAALELQKMGYKTTSFCRLDSWKKNGYKIKKEQPQAQPESWIRPFVNARTLRA